MKSTLVLAEKQSYFSKSHTDCIKGIFALMVVICHIWGQISSEVNTGGFIIHNLGRLFTIMGYISVSIFFFLSGYGLMSQHEKFGENYIKAFPKRNILSLYAINLFLIGLYCLFNVLMQVRLDLSILAFSLLYGNTIIPYGWYLQAIILFYIFFYISSLITKKHMEKIIIVFFLLFIYCLVANKFLSLTWYECSFTFVLGMLFKIRKDRIDSIIKRHYTLFLTFAILLFLLSCFWGNKTFSLIGIFLKIISTILFCFVIVLLAMKVNFKNPLTTFLSNIYLEIYALQGITIAFFRSNIVYVKDAYLYGATVILATVALAYIFHPVFRKILSFFK